jgi:hypothetical protein
METIDLYAAILEMRKLSANNECFSFAFMSYNRDRQSTDGMVYVKRAILRPAAKGDDIANANYKLFYTDLDAPDNQNRNCWQPALMYFNQTKIVLR